jgi:magnesium transporter
MISLYRWSPEQGAAWLDPAALRTEAEALRDAPGVYWVDLEAPTPDEEALVFERFCPVHPLTLRDITLLRRPGKRLPHLPKVEEFPDYLFVVINPPGRHLLDRIAGKQPGPADRARPLLTQLSAVLTRWALVTHHYEPLPAVAELRVFLQKHQDQSGRGPDYLFHIVLDALIDQFAPLLDRVHGELDRLEGRVFRRPTPRLLRRLLRLKRRVALLRRTLTLEREVAARLARGEFGLIEEREMAYYRNVYDHVVRFTELLDGARENATDLLQTHLAATGNRLNEVMKALTMISTVVLPMTLVAGIYGMNFKHMPELEWEYGYPLALGLMALTGVASFTFFRWKGWF